MKKYFSISALALGCMAAAALSSCYEDRGNYVYTDLAEVRIDEAANGIQEVYVLDRGSRLAINPDVYYNGKKVAADKDAPLDYLWTFYDQHTGAGVDYTVDTLANTKALDAQITRKGGNYYAQLTVKNRENGVETYFRAKCQVEESVTSGWMMIYERGDKPGYSDVGLVANPFVKKNVTDSRSTMNIYSLYNGGAIEGRPVRIVHECLPLPNGNILIATDKNLETVTQQDFVKSMNWDDHFFAPQKKGNISYFGMNTSANATKWTLIMDNEVRVASGSGAASTFFGYPKINDEGVGELAPWGSYNIMSVDVVVYDQTCGTFYYTQVDKRDYYWFAKQTGPFNLGEGNLQGRKLLFGDTGANFVDVMLFSHNGSYFLGVANFRMPPTVPTVGQQYVDVTSSPEIAKVSAFAANGVGQYAYYGAGNKVYNLAYMSGRPAAVAWEAPSADEVVTCISTQKYYYLPVYTSVMPNKDAVVHIATYNEKTKEGKLYQYMINPASGEINLTDTHYEYSVPGRVKDMGWKYSMDR